MPPAKRPRKSAKQGDTYCTRDLPQGSVLKKVTDRQPHSWTNVPETALRYIFTMLPDVERASMARVCKSWNHGFHDGELWRSRAFDFGQKPEFKHNFEELVNENLGLKFINGQKAIKFATQFPTCLDKMYIMFQNMPGQNRNNVIGDFTRFSTCFDQSNLTTLYVDHLKLYIFKD